MESDDDLNDYLAISVHDWNVAQAQRLYGIKIFRFWHFLHEFPMMGMVHPVGRKILRELEKAPKILIGESHWFRALHEREFIASLPPPEIVGDQRYNNAGQVYRYFADSAKCAVAESTSQKETRTAWVQRFRIDGLHNILDLRPWNDENERADQNDEGYRPFLLALIFCELLTQVPEHYFNHLIPEEKKRVKWHPAYLMPRFVADSARYCGFSGILYRSIRYRGDNLVVFNCDENLIEDGVAQELTLTKEDLIVDGHFVM